MGSGEIVDVRAMRLDGRQVDLDGRRGRTFLRIADAEEATRPGVVVVLVVDAVEQGLGVTVLRRIGLCVELENVFRLRVLVNGIRQHIYIRLFVGMLYVGLC